MKRNVVAMTVVLVFALITGAALVVSAVQTDADYPELRSFWITLGITYVFVCWIMVRLAVDVYRLARKRHHHD